MKNNADNSIKKISMLFVVVVVMALAWKAYIYRAYAGAFFWHMFHGNTTVFDGNRITLPRSWQIGNHYGHGIAIFTRAVPPGEDFGANIIVTSMPPGLENLSGQEEQEAMNKSIDKKISKNGLPPTETSIFEIQSSSRKFYCKLDEIGSLHAVRLDNFQCYAANFKYAISYGGSSQYEREAQSIIASLR